MAENEDKIVLTLGEEKVEEEVVTEENKETVQEHANVPVSDVVGYAKLDDSSLTEDEKKMVDDFAKQIDIMETNTVLQYGATAQSKVADFSDTALKNVRTKDIDTVGDTLLDLVSQLRNFEVDDKNDNFFTKIFKKSSNSINDVKAKYDSANSNVDKIVKILENHQITLMKDISLLDQLYEKNLLNFKELTMYILAGYKRLDEIKKNDLPAALKKAEETGLPEDAQAANDLSEAINRFEKKLHDLELTRMVSIQMAPQIRLVQNNDTLMTEKIQSTLVNTIPLWKSQMLIALGIAHSKEAVKAQNEVSEMTNKMLKENAEALKMATIETAKESERGIVDIETLTETNKKLIETLEEVKRIQTEGREKRLAAQNELRRIETQLQHELTDVIQKEA
ncbi:MAG: toxic anion resistance protein [Erysipelotrichaceae bacterium]|nr:toxic anion resistance protein [Erysipelotrichaceae bacterium]MBQ1346932.1 toxic anion resistance protein [Erysipelotrichaceae bacterium]MBQ2079294.1 toxic anion resistance protein [Erysipelotrichaceae bacterium]MBQ9158489.1 toxic anion resistance protein [Erysipelotrichaceae bacterium]MEE3408957.1 toxic anion resistance protein [Erysipelotrichaceae bacterium]